MFSSFRLSEVKYGSDARWIFKMKLCVQGAKAQTANLCRAHQRDHLLFVVVFCFRALL